MPMRLAWLILLLLAPAALAENIFDLARKPNQRVVISLDRAPPAQDLLSSPAMQRRMAGILCELSAKQRVDLCTSVDSRASAAKAATPGGTSSPSFFVHMDGPSGSRSIAITQLANGEYFAERIDSADTKHQPKPTKLRPELIDRLLDGASEGSGYLGLFTLAPPGQPGAPAPAPAGEFFDCPAPYTFSPIQLDAPTIRERIGSSQLVKYNPTARVLQKEKFIARLPRGYDPKSPAGLLVYIDPSPAGRLPSPMVKALDQLGLISIAPVDAGNGRFVTERLQLGLDAVATARRRWHIDPTRIYITGISGGGKMAGESLICFPDIYRGAVSIVGVNWWENVPTGEGNRIWPAEFSKPTGPRWQLVLQRPLAAVTGDQDFNHAPVTAGVALFERAGMKVKLFDIPGMGHECPSADAFLQQLSWVDEPARSKRDANESQASAALQAARSIQDEKTRAAELVRIVTTWPWTKGAWEAITPTNAPASRAPHAK